MIEHNAKGYVELWHSNGAVIKLPVDEPIESMWEFPKGIRVSTENHVFELRERRRNRSKRRPFKLKWLGTRNPAN